MTEQITYTTIEAQYSGTPTSYTFLCKIELAQTLEVGSIVIVKAKNGLGVVRVSAAHSTPQDTGKFQYRWAFQKVNLDEIAVLEQAQLQKNIARVGGNAPETHEQAPPFKPDVPDDVAAMKAAMSKEAPKAAANPTDYLPTPEEVDSADMKGSPNKTVPPVKKVSIPSVPKL